MRIRESIFRKSIRLVYLLPKTEKLTKVFFVRKAFLWFFRFIPSEMMVEVEGNKMYVIPRRSGTERTLFIFRSYEKGITRLFHSLIKSGMTVVDIGAHVGYYTLLAAQIVGPEGKVFAFEPEPKNFELLNKNVVENGYHNVTLVKKAVSNVSSKSRLSLDLTDSGRNFLTNTSKNTIEVSTIFLDEFFDDGIVINLIKMDIEGFEEKALDGMERVLKKEM